MARAHRSAYGMPPARSASAAPRARTRPASGSRPGPRRLSGPRLLHRRPPHARVRWDRVGRVALLVVLAIVAGLYVQHAVSFLSARSQSARQQALVHQLQRDNRQLLRQQTSLRDPATIALYARKLGMVKPGERPFVITGSPTQ
jgi:cell division protein FtsB